jgi:hypothetical protein
MHPLQLDQGSILDKKFTMVLYNALSNIKLTCINNNPILKEILNFQLCYLLSKCL